MKIKKISLLNFRNCGNINISLNEGMNIFIGDNAQGKTNILEAITMLALTKSHRVGVNPNIIMFNKKKSQIKGIVKKDKIITKLQIDITEEKKDLMINQNSIKKVADYISNLNVIIFTPDDLEIIKGSPNIRRNLLNIQLSQISKTYLNTYNEYNKILKTRNEYLKILFNNSIADKNYLDILTDKLIEKAVVIYRKRLEYIDFINGSINKYYKEIADFEGLSVEYLTSFDIKNLTDDEIKEKLKDYFDKYYNKELNYGMTMYGPHRDDFYFNFNGNDLKYFGSQGQQKLAVLCLKLSEIGLFKEVSGFNPVILLDDIFSELDIKKRNRLLKFVGDNDIQSIITTTDLKSINKKYLNESYIYEVKNGNIERK